MSNRSSTKLWLYTFFIAALIISNLLGAKMISVCGFTMPAGTLGYAATFLITDVIGELWGKKEANDLVLKGFISLLFCNLFIKLALILPAAYPCESFNQVFNMSSRIILGSITAYLISQFLDVTIFHKMQAVFPKHKFIRNNISTMVSQFVDTAIFVLIAFYGVADNILAVIFGTYVAKVVIALFDTPFFYLLTRRSIVHE